MTVLVLKFYLYDKGPRSRVVGFTYKMGNRSRFYGPTKSPGPVIPISRYAELTTNFKEDIVNAFLIHFDDYHPAYRKSIYRILMSLA